VTAYVSTKFIKYERDDTSEHVTLTWHISIIPNKWKTHDRVDSLPTRTDYVSGTGRCERRRTLWDSGISRITVEHMWVSTSSPQRSSALFSSSAVNVAAGANCRCYYRPPSGHLRVESVLRLNLPFCQYTLRELDSNIRILAARGSPYHIMST
jgi:hypothetical protein